MCASCAMLPVTTQTIVRQGKTKRQETCVLCSKRKNDSNYGSPKKKNGLEYAQKPLGKNGLEFGISSLLKILTFCDSGASTVAIDNKIEQAMDLVKSHLMYAVREEVEVLKEQIKELLEKNSQLEYENSVLRSEAKPETLAKLNANQSKPPASSS